MSRWRFLWRSFVIKFYWHKTVWVGAHCGECEDSYPVSCDPLETGCLQGCRRQAKRATWEAEDVERKRRGCRGCTCCMCHDGCDIHCEEMERTCRIHGVQLPAARLLSTKTSDTIR